MKAGNGIRWKKRLGAGSLCLCLFLGVSLALADNSGYGAVFVAPAEKPWRQQPAAENTPAPIVEPPFVAAEREPLEEFSRMEALSPWQKEETEPAPGEAYPPVLEATLAPMLTPVPLSEEPEEAEITTFSLLLAGIDNRNLEQLGRSDTVILAQFHLDSGKVKLVSFLRDLYVKIPGKNSNRLHSAYTYGGIDLLRDTLVQNFDLSIDAVVAVDFTEMANIVDSLGGISLKVSEKEREEVNLLLRETYGTDSGLELPQEGEQTLLGIQALYYSRIQKLDNDFLRSNRQQRVLEAMLDKIMETDAVTVLRLMRQHLGAVKTTLTEEDLTRLIPLVLKRQEITFDSMRVPVDHTFYDDIVRGMMVLQMDLLKNREAVTAFLAE